MNDKRSIHEGQLYID